MKRQHSSDISMYIDHWLNKRKIQDLHESWFIIALKDEYEKIIVEIFEDE